MKGTQCQTSTTITDHSASEVEPSQLTGAMPSPPSIWLKTPKSWLNISLNMLPMATGGTRIGTIINVRRRALPRDMAPTASASARPATISMATATTTNSSVLRTTGPSAPSATSSDQLCSGVKLQRSLPSRNSIVDTAMRSRLTTG